MGLKYRLDRLHAALSPQHADTGARERFRTKLLAISETHRARRQRGEEPVPNAHGIPLTPGTSEPS